MPYNLSLNLQKLPVYYQLLLSKIDPKNQDKISEKISQYSPIVADKPNFYIHPLKKSEYTNIEALAHVLLDLRSEDENFRSNAMVSYISFKFSLQLDLINEWHRVSRKENENYYYLYFNALSLTDEKKYDQAIAIIETILVNFDIRDIKLDASQAMFLIDCVNLYILNLILANNINKAKFELSQIYILIERISQEKEIYYSYYFMTKQKELLLYILNNETIKINSLIRDFNNNKKSIKDYYALGLFLSLLALYYAKDQDFNRTEDLLKEAGNNFSLLGSGKLVTDIYYNLLALKLQQGNIFDAIEIYEDKNSIFKNKNDIISSLKFSILFCETYLTTNEINKSRIELNWIIENKEQLYRIRDIDYWLLLHSLAERHDHDELRGITNDKIEVLFLGGNINENLIYIYNIRKTALYDYSKGDFDKASRKLVSDKSNLINMKIIGFNFDINLDLMRIYLKQYEFSKNRSIFNKIMILFDDLEVYIKSTKSLEASIFHNQAKISFMVSANEFENVGKDISNLITLLENNKSKNRFIESLLASTIKLKTNLERYANNKFFFLISELNKYDLTNNITTYDIFIPSNTATIEELWRNMFIRQCLISISILRIQRLNKFDLTQLNINRIPGLMRSFE